MLHPRVLLTRAVAAAIVLAAVAAIPSGAQSPSPSSGAGAPTAGERRVRDGVLAKFRVLPVQNGIVLVPRSRIDGVDNIELREGTIAINGHPATGGEVRDRMGRDADVVLELSYMDLAAQKQLLLPAESAPAGKTEPAPVEPTAPPVVEAPSEPERPVRSYRRHTETRVRIGGDVVVDSDEQVNGPVVAVLGSVTINGRVRDDVVAVGGDVRLGPQAEVNGGVTAVGGRVDRDPDAHVGGEVNEVSFSVPPVRIRPFWHPDWVPWFRLDAGPWRAFRLVGTLLRMALFTLLATLCLLLAPTAVRRVETAVQSQPWRSALVGLLAQLFFVPVLVVLIVVLAISIIGIPLLALVPFAVLAFFVALLLGFTGASAGLARVVQHRFSWSAPTSFAMLIVGMVMVWGMTVLGRLVGLGGGPFAVLGGILVFFGFLIEYAAWTVGLGGALLTRFGRHGAVALSGPPQDPDLSAPSSDFTPPPLP
jgi:hypothetical protein